MSKMSSFATSFRRLSSKFTSTTSKNSFFPRSKFFGISCVLGVSSFISYNTIQNVSCNAYIEHDHDEGGHFHLLEALGQISSKISPNAMLRMFQAMVDDLGNECKISLQLLVELFKMVGVEDQLVAEHIFKTMDWDHSGFLETSEVAAVMTLFQQGSDTDRYKFLFNCIDLNGNQEVDKDEFRSLLTALLEAHYKLQGLTDPFLPNEIFENITFKEYHTVAKWRANRLVMDIFNYADTNRDGVLSQNEFLKWCRRGGREVDMVRDILKDTFSTVGGY